MKEIWINIPEFENYQVSNLGNVFSKKSNKLLCITKNDKGYCYVQIYKNNKDYHFRLHRLVAKCFIPNPNNFKEINHIDGNKQNNCVENLEWCDRKYNMQEAFKNGLIPPRKANSGSFKKGRKPPNCKKVNKYNLSYKLIKSYSSITEASIDNNVSPYTISRYCIGTRKCKNYIWRYADE
jgi:hypothetical protein